MVNRFYELLSYKGLLLLTIGLAILAGVELIWLVGANWALSSGFLEARLNRRPEKLKVEWNRAHTLIPGLISVQGLSVRGQSRKQQWYLELGRGQVHLSLTALTRRTFKTYSVKATGLDFRLRKRLATTETQPLAQFWPTIPGLAIDAPSPPPRKHHVNRPWVIDLGEIRVDLIKQVWILPNRLVSRGTIRADLRVEVQGFVAIDRVVGALRGAEIFARGSRIAHGLSLDFEASLDPFSPAEVKGLAVWRSLSGSLALAGQSTTSGLLSQMLPSSGPIEVGGTGGGAIAGTVLIGHGELLEGSHFELTREDGWLGFLDWRALGEIEARFEVSGVGETGRTILTLSLDGVDVVGEDLEVPLLQGASVELMAAAGGLDLTRGIPGLTSSLTSIRLDLTNATVADITRFPMPPVENFSLDSGTLVVEGHAEVGRTGAEAWLEAAGESIGATYGDVALNGNLSVELKMVTRDLASRQFTVVDSSIAIDNVTIGEGKKAQKNWYAHLDILEGTLSLGEPNTVDGAIELRMRDSRPIVALLLHRRPFLRRLQRILDFSDLTGTASISVAAGGMVVEEVDLTGDGLHIMARLEVASSKASGILYSRFHGLPFGVDLRGDKAKLVFRHPKRWYEAQAALEESQRDSVSLVSLESSTRDQ